jgi:acyl-lipid omega-6 desaturase (Delta-12 desaturase)
MNNNASNINHIIEHSTADDRSWQEVIMKYNSPDLRKSIWQICNSVIPYIFMWYIMYRSLAYPYWVTLLLSVLASGFLIRIFIIFHDCGHRSFFKLTRTNNFVGIIMGILAFTPFFRWHHQHWIHHATSANLDKRGIGDVWTMTVGEYLRSSKWEKFSYRSFRNPFFMYTIGPLLVVLVQNRFTKKKMTGLEKRNSYFTNIMLLLMAVSISLLIGIRAYLLIQVPIILISHAIGLWLFYIQHQFDDVAWERDSKWDYRTSAFTGSSFLKLPAVLQWFTGNIGFHHIHHLSSRIPNYNLEKCHYENEIFRIVKPVKLFSTFKALKLALWDEEDRRMISFKSLSRMHMTLAKS